MKKITTIVLIVAITLVPRAYAGPADALRPPSTESNEQMSQEQAEAQAQELFERVRIGFGVAEGSLPLLPSRVTSIGELLRKGSMTADQVYDNFFKMAEREARLLAHARPISEDEAAIIREAEALVNRFLAPYGMRCPAVRVAAVAPEFFSDETMAQFLPLHATIAILAEYESEIVALTAAVHERLHSAVAGFGPERLDEGMTRYLTTRILMERDGIEDASTQALRAYYCKSMGYELKPGQFPIEFMDVEAILAIRDSMDDEVPLLRAYVTGDTRGLTTVLGVRVWRAMQELALLYSAFVEGPHDTIDRPQMVRNSLSYMNGIVQAVAEGNEEIHLLDARRTAVVSQGSARSA